MNFDEADELRSTFTTYLAEGDKVRLNLKKFTPSFSLKVYWSNINLNSAFHQWRLYKSIGSLFEGANAETWW